MTEPRLDLLELTPEALMALANPGFVKRALRDLAEGRRPQISVRADQAIVALYEDGHTAVLGPGQTLRDASCTCPASNLCRHRVTLIPAYQHWVKSRPAAADSPTAEEAEAESANPDEDWSPADFSEAQIAASFKKGVLKQAEALAKTGPTIRLVGPGAESGPPTAYLPMSTVRFFSARNLAHARCDCLEGSGCAHVVLAIRAFRQAGRRGRDGSELTLVLEPEGQGKVRLFDGRAERCLEAVHDLLGQIWREGLSQPLLALEEKLTMARALAEDLKWRWISEAVDDLRRSFEAYQARSSRFSGPDFMAALAFLYARLECARYAEAADDPAAASPAAPAVPASQILGLGVAGEVALEHLTLVGLGTEIWDDARQNGIRSYFVDPDTMTSMVLERGYDKIEETAQPASGPGASSNSPAGGSFLAKRLAGLSLRKLSHSQIVTRGAKRRANGLVTIAANARLTNALALSARSWDNLGRPLKWPGARALKDYLRTRPPEFIEPRQALRRLAVLPVGVVITWGWEPGSQRLSALLSDGPDPASGDDGQAGSPDGPEPGRYRLELPYRKIEESAVDNLARHLDRGDIDHICGLVKLAAGEICLRPLALTTAKEMVVLATHNPGGAEPGSGQSAAVIRADSSAADEEPDSELGLRLKDLRYFLLQYLLTGLRHRHPQVQNDLRATGRDLARLGLPVCAGLMEALEKALHQNDHAAQLAAISRLTLLLHQLQKESLVSVNGQAGLT